MLDLMTTEEHITQLEHQLHELQGQQAELRKQLAKAQLDQWRGRIEDLEVQMHLGGVEASDKATAQMTKLRDRWADARRLSRKASRRRPSWQTPCGLGWRAPLTISAQPSLNRRTS